MPILLSGIGEIQEASDMAHSLTFNDGKPQKLINIPNTGDDLENVEMLKEIQILEHINETMHSSAS
jgi:hypothetical protein